MPFLQESLTESNEELPVATALVGGQRQDAGHVVPIWGLLLLRGWVVRASGETQPLLGFIHPPPPASLNLGFPAPLRSSQQCGLPACPPRSRCKRRTAPHQSTASYGPGRAWPADTGSDSKSEGLGSRLRGQAERLHLAPSRSGQVLPPCLVQVPGSSRQCQSGEKWDPHQNSCVQHCKES